MRSAILRAVNRNQTMISVLLLLVASVVTAAPPKAGDEGVFHGPLVRVIDGDSLKVKVQDVVMEFRLAEVDAPEMGQPYGPTSKRELLTLVRGKSLVVVPFETDRYGRTVAHVWVGAVHVNREMVARGAGWFYSRYAMSNELYDVEQDARDARRGLWALSPSDRIPPEQWREQQRKR